jgi:hypothetical protein
MYNIIKQSSNTYPNEDYTLIDLLPKKDESNMKNELKNFLKKQLQVSSQERGTDISALDSMSNSNSFSLYKN